MNYERIKEFVDEWLDDYAPLIGDNLTYEECETQYSFYVKEDPRHPDVLTIRAVEHL